MFGVIPTPTITTSAGTWLPSAEPDTAGPAAGAGDLGDLDAETQVDAVLAVQVGEDLRDLLAEHPQQRQLGRLQDRDLGPRGPGGGRGLQADPARADHHDPRRGLERGLDLVAVGDPAQVKHAVQVAALDRQAPWRRPRGQ